MTRSGPMSAEFVWKKKFTRNIRAANLIVTRVALLYTTFKTKAIRG